MRQRRTATTARYKAAAAAARVSGFRSARLRLSPGASARRGPGSGGHLGDPTAPSRRELEPNVT